MSVTGVHGQPLEINVVGCRSLRDTEWISRQDPYVVIEYANNKFRTKTDTDGGRNPSFNQKFTVSLIEGLREINVQVWNSNTIAFDDLIGTGRAQIEKALSTGYDDTAWPLMSKHGKYAGEVRLILHYANARNSKPYGAYGYQAPSPSAPPYSSHPPPAAYPSAYPAVHGPTAGYPAQGSSSAYQPPVGVPYASRPAQYAAPPAPYAAPMAPYPSPATSYPPPYYPPAPPPVYGPPPGAYPPVPYPGYGYPSPVYCSHGKHKHKGHKHKKWKYGKK
ncbi:hypothetical protein O6H91_21G059200 [Diphasiastrum complanatum]|uniref:Uncharacterized protein n=4 Tax=Diphasiastrum complanatum TaxID=34168 RepID=A0ACC2AKX8_DIPCM|nr:hypothetical protein O6H91_Y529200 [Diphasiastrum complanatum]KAJ7189976.1 hypothetical protein O6H91_Y529200 [Diphasiastrum complanatum]KAJ7189977.1 hypothetical protein O6H91_Y529200 [Diphasiastrum complanatum]KAJ7518216.1 hypothetical protein O6H91_21G059200 [Diphasiastrum complanatum]KAJ7518217.1 hypothetical protein O6H91_21G059200 [Diphasiastrum complanatum]